MKRIAIISDILLIVLVPVGYYYLKQQQAKARLLKAQTDGAKFDKAVEQVADDIERTNKQIAFERKMKDLLSKVGMTKAKFEPIWNL